MNGTNALGTIQVLRNAIFLEIGPPRKRHLNLKRIALKGIHVEKFYQIQIPTRAKHVTASLTNLQSLNMTVQSTYHSFLHLIQEEALRSDLWRKHVNLGQGMYILDIHKADICLTCLHVECTLYT